MFRIFQFYAQQPIRYKSTEYLKYGDNQSHFMVKTKKNENFSSFGKILWYDSHNIQLPDQYYSAMIVLIPGQIMLMTVI